MKETSLYEAVIGLEVHAELATRTKIFCACPTDRRAPANTQCCPVCLGLPGSMPTLNRRAVELGVLAGLALGCRIAPLSRFDRKQYFYPDLPKAYQISQDDQPLCTGGLLELPGEGKRIPLRRIHLEEDAGKLMHREEGTEIDCNRCGVPLIEIVSEPAIASPEEAVSYLKELRAVLVAAGVSDCRMEEGAFRCDINVSLRRPGEGLPDWRVEIKNVNSFSFAEKALRFELRRLSERLEAGERVHSETRRYDAARGVTQAMREKESAEDYRFLREPDLGPLVISEETVERLRAGLPELPAARRQRLEENYAIPPADAAILAPDPALAAYFEEAAAVTRHPRLAANLLLSELLRHAEREPFRLSVSPHRVGEVAELFGERVINSATVKRLLARLLTGDFSPARAVEEEGLAMIRDTAILDAWAEEVLSENARAVRDLLGGKHAALGALAGRMMQKSGGRADPELSEKALLFALKRLETENK